MFAEAIQFDTGEIVAIFLVIFAVFALWCLLMIGGSIVVWRFVRRGTHEKRFIATVVADVMLALAALTSGLDSPTMLLALPPVLHGLLGAASWATRPPDPT